ncbi:MAG: Rad52/Rad22 family DNA repair protein [Chloroflexota bacterium]
MPFSTSQLEQLEARIDEGRVHTRRKQGMELRYLEGHDVIDMANTVFGYHAWSYQVTKLELNAGVWVATILLSVSTADGEMVQREDVGVGIPAVARDAGEATPDAQETAIKGAVTDALKRALRTFGNAFGNSLYDKDAPTSRDEQPARLQPRVFENAAEGEEAHPCPSCDQLMVLRSGTTRDGRPYSAWFCSAKCGQKPVWLAERKAS